MLKEEKLPKVYEGGVVSGQNEVRALTIKTVDQMQALTLEEMTNIEKHGHENDQWEVYIDIINKMAYICGIGKEHQFLNMLGKEQKIMAIKGKFYTTEELMVFFKKLGLNVFVV